MDNTNRKKKMDNADREMNSIKWKMDNVQRKTKIEKRIMHTREWIQSNRNWIILIGKIWIDIMNIEHRTQNTEDRIKMFMKWASQYMLMERQLMGT